MTHLKRAGVLLSVVLLALFIVPRVMPIPEFLLDFGFHDADEQENKELWASLPMQYANPLICNDCHQDQYGIWVQADHRTVSCENCHGPSMKHLEGNEFPVDNTSGELCSSCHASLISRPSHFPQVDLEEHGGQAACITCHNPHDPREGMPPRLLHSIEGRENCQSCHNPSEPLAELPPQMPHSLEGRTDCASCHGKTESPQPALPEIPHSLEGRDNCLVCHNTSAIKPFSENHIGRTTDTCLNCHQKE